MKRLPASQHFTLLLSTQITVVFYELQLFAKSVLDILYTTELINNKNTMNCQRTVLFNHFQN